MIIFFTKTGLIRVLLIIIIPHEHLLHLFNGNLLTLKRGTCGNGETRKKKAKDGRKRRNTEKNEKFNQIFKHLCIISVLVMHKGTVFYTAVPGDSSRRIGSRYGSVSLASQSRDTVPYPETLPLSNSCHPRNKCTKQKLCLLFQAWSWDFPGRSSFSNVTSSFQTVAVRWQLLKTDLNPK